MNPLIRLMKMSLNLKISGFDEAAANIVKVKDSVQGPFMTDAAIAAMQPVLEDARRLIPVDQGEARDSLGISDRAVGGVARRGGTVYFGPLAGTVLHVFFLEFGTVKMRAQPSIIPAVEANQDLVFDILGDDVGRQIEQSF